MSRGYLQALATKMAEELESLRNVGTQTLPSRPLVSPMPGGGVPGTLSILTHKPETHFWSQAGWCSDHNVLHVEPGAPTS